MFREAFFILIMRGDYDGLLAFHIPLHRGEGDFTCRCRLSPDSHTKYGQRAGIAWLSPPFVHLFPTLHTLCMGIGWEVHGFSHLSSTLSPPFIPFAWVKGGKCLASPTFRPPFPHPSYPCMGKGWACLAFPTFVHPFPTLHTLCMGIGWAFPIKSV